MRLLAVFRDQAPVGGAGGQLDAQVLPVDVDVGRIEVAAPEHVIALRPAGRIESGEIVAEVDPCVEASPAFESRKEVQQTAINVMYQAARACGNPTISP